MSILYVLNICCLVSFVIAIQYMNVDLVISGSVNYAESSISFLYLEYDGTSHNALLLIWKKNDVL